MDAKCRAHAVTAAVVAFSVVSSGCGRGRYVEPAVTPTIAAAGLARCDLVPSQLRPLVVEWSGTDRGSLELALSRGVVVVRYEGCSLELLPDCSAPGSYAFAGFTRKHDTITIRSADELYGQMPIGASRLETRLERVGALQVDMTLVGERRVGRGSYARDELSGTCAGATHVLSAAQVGAFTFHAGAATTATATGAAAEDLRELINSDGSPAACEAANPTDPSAPPQCGALLRLELSKIRPAAPRAVAQAEPRAVAQAEPPPAAPPPAEPASAEPKPESQPPTTYWRPDERFASLEPNEPPPSSRRYRSSVDGDVAFAVLGGVFGLTALGGLATIAAGAAGIAGDEKTDRDPTDSRKILKAGVGITLSAAALTGLFFALAYHGPCKQPRMRMVPMVGRGYGGLGMAVNF